jgi:hypothetical protein
VFVIASLSVLTRMENRPRKRLPGKGKTFPQYLSAAAIIPSLRFRDPDGKGNLPFRQRKH